jgi:Fe-S cluster biogenesis protein NfuA
MELIMNVCGQGRQGEEEPMRERVQKVIDEIRPALQADGGDVSLVDVGEDGVVKVRLMGACGGCPMSQMTLKMGIERRLKEKVPEVTSVVSV